jgi:hypothetical protein
MTDFLGTDPEQARFDEGWKRYKANVQGFNEYWYPEPGKWSPAPGVIDLGLTPTEAPFADFAGQVYGKVKASWDSVRKSHSEAMWDPKTRKWFSKPKAGPPEDEKTKRLRADLAYLKSLLDKGVITREEHDRRRQEIIARSTGTP